MNTKIYRRERENWKLLFIPKAAHPTCQNYLTLQARTAVTLRANNKIIKDIIQMFFGMEETHLYLPTTLLTPSVPGENSSFYAS